MHSALYFPCTGLPTLFVKRFRASVLIPHCTPQSLTWFQYWNVGISCESWWHIYTSWDSTVQYWNHMMACSVQGATGSKNSEMTVYLPLCVPTVPSVVCIYIVHSSAVSSDALCIVCGLWFSLPQWTHCWSGSCNETLAESWAMSQHLSWWQRRKLTRQSVDISKLLLQMQILRVLWQLLLCIAIVKWVSQAIWFVWTKMTWLIDPTT